MLKLIKRVNISHYGAFAPKVKIENASKNKASVPIAEAFRTTLKDQAKKILGHINK